MAVYSIIIVNKELLTWNLYKIKLILWKTDEAI
jgi:hypothetical protein